MKKLPLEYGKMACDAMMRRYAPEELPPERVLFYHQGVFLAGMQQIYKLCGEKKYFKYVKDYVDSLLGEDGEIPGFDHEMNTSDTPWIQKMALTKLDNRQPCILLFDLYEESGEEKYRNAIEKIVKSMYYWPVNSVGGYWHMMDQPYQMWLDGAYMAGPMCVQYDNVFGDSILRDRAVKQLLLMEEYMKDKKTGLYYHGWDESKKEIWADPETGLSSQFWGRAVGWYAVAILDCLEYLPEGYAAAERLRKMEKDLLASLVHFQDTETGLWYQVLDRVDARDNWVESSCTNLFIYSYAKAKRMGITCSEFDAVLEKAYNGICDRLKVDEKGDVVIDEVCIGTCIETGTYEHYIKRPKIKNDLHGVGAFLLMCAEMEQYWSRKGKTDKEGDNELD